MNALYRVPISGGTSTNLSNLESTITSTRGAGWFWISPDSRHVVFVASFHPEDVQNLFTVPILGGDRVHLNPDMVTEGEIDELQISPDSQWAVFMADQDEHYVTELYSTEIRYIKLTEDSQWVV